MRDRLDNSCVPVARSLKDAMLVLEKGATGIALVLDEHRRLLGTLTDGDIRRALLAGSALDSPLQPHVNRQFTAVLPGAHRDAVLDLMRARGIHQVPVLDADGVLVGLHLMRELLGLKERPNLAVVMAGGRGHRLAPLTEQVPKPMLRVAGRPILERIVLQLVSAGFRSIYLAVNYLGDVIERHFHDGSDFGCSIRYLRETTPLGTAGALSLLPQAPSAPLLVMNGDLVTQADLAAMLDHHESHNPAVTMAVKQYAHAVPFGCVEVRDERVLSLEEKPTLTRLVNAGIYVLDPSVVRRVRTERACAMTELVEECLAARERVNAFEIDDEWIDVGRPAHLELARGGEGR